MSLLINPGSLIYSLSLDLRMFIGIILMVFYIGLIEFVHLHKPKDDMRKVLLPITVVMSILFVLILIRKLSGL